MNFLGSREPVQRWETSLVLIGASSPADAYLKICEKKTDSTGNDITMPTLGLTQMFLCLRGVYSVYWHQKDPKSRFAWCGKASCVEDVVQ